MPTTCPDTSKSTMPTETSSLFSTATSDSVRSTASAF